MNTFRRNVWSVALKWNPFTKPRARISINAVIQTEGFTGRPINGYAPQGTHSGDCGQPPDYDFVICRKTRPEVWVSRTAGATDQTFLRNVPSIKKAIHVMICNLIIGMHPTLKASDITARGNAPGKQIRDAKPRAHISINAVIPTEGVTGRIINGNGPSAPILKIADNLRIMISWFFANPGRRWNLLHDIPGLVFARQKPPGVTR